MISLERDSAFWGIPSLIRKMMLRCNIIYTFGRSAWNRFRFHSFRPMNDTLFVDKTQTSLNRAAERNGTRRGTFLKWLRKVHGWVGLWGALLGLMFGLTGFFQNHRAVLKIGTPEPQVSTVQLAVPSPVPQNPNELAAWLQGELKLSKPAERIQRERAKPVAWGDKAVTQPEHWQMNFRAPHYVVQAEYWVGSGQVSVRRSEAGVLAILENLHRGNGVGMGWVLMADSLAGSLILLSITGVLLWTELNRRKTLGAVIAAVSIGATLVLASQSF